MEKARKIEVFIIVAIIGVFGAVYALTHEKVSAPTNETQEQTQDNKDSVQLVPSSTIKYQGQTGQTALELLKSSHRVDTKSTSFGDMVVGVDGVGVDESKQYWAFYVNGALSQEGAGTYQTKSTDQIEWKVESF